jgi:putative transposase
MSLNALRRGNHVKIGAARFLIQQKLGDNNWQLQNTATGEWCRFTEDELLDQFSRNELVFDRDAEDHASSIRHSSAGLDRALSTYPAELVVMAQNRVQYLKEIDRLQPIAITSKTMEPLIRSVSERIKDTKPPGWRTLARGYTRWLRGGRDIRAVILRHSDKGSRGPRLIPEVKAATDEVIDELYMTEERKCVPEVHLEIVRRLADSNRFRPADASLPIPSRRTIYREIERRPPYELMVARYGKRRAEMEFRVSGSGPETSRALQRVSMDHTPSDMIVADDATMLPLGRPTITSALDEHTRCPMGFYMGFEPPSCLSVMRCLKHARGDHAIDIGFSEVMSRLRPQRGHLFVVVCFVVAPKRHVFASAALNVWREHPEPSIVGFGAISGGLSIQGFRRNKAGKTRMYGHHQLLGRRRKGACRRTR